MKTAVIMYRGIGVYFVMYIYFSLSLARVFFCYCVFKLILTMCDCHGGIKGVLIDYDDDMTR